MYIYVQCTCIKHIFGNTGAPANHLDESPSQLDSMNQEEEIGPLLSEEKRRSRASSSNEMCNNSRNQQTIHRVPGEHNQIQTQKESKRWGIVNSIVSMGLTS